MNIIITDISNFFDKFGIEYKLQFENEKLNQSINYFRLLEDYGPSIAENNLGIDLRTILYSKYYWFSEFIKYYKQEYGNDCGIDQKQFKILEEIDQQLCEGVDFSILQEIDELVLKNNS